MATQDDVRRIAMSLPGTTEDPNGFRFLVDGKQDADSAEPEEYIRSKERLDDARRGANPWART